MDQEKVIARMQNFIRRLENGEIVLPSAIGPNSIKKNSIKAKSITSTMIDVNDLEAVNANTGDLSVTGNLTMTTSGAIRAGKTAYSDTVNSGYWLGVDSAVPKFRIGSTTQQLLWDGTNLTITGSITATTGTIGGWTIGTTDITADAGATGMASSGSYRFWTGSATPSAAEFSVTSAGLVTMTSAAIGGWNVDATGIRLGSGGTARGMDSGSTAFYAGSATPSSAPFRVTTAGAVTMTSSTITGAITASSLSITGSASFSGGSLTLPSGGTITSSSLDMNSGTMAGLTIDGTLTIGSGGKIAWNGTSSYIDENEIVLTSGAYNNLSMKVSTTLKGYIYTDSTVFTIAAYNGADLNLVAASANAFLTSITGDTNVEAIIGDVNILLGDSGGTKVFGIFDSGGTSGVIQFGVNSNGDLIRQITNDATGLGAYYGRVPIYINGSLKYLAVYS